MRVRIKIVVVVVVVVVVLQKIKPTKLLGIQCAFCPIECTDLITCKEPNSSNLKVRGGITVCGRRSRRKRRNRVFLILDEG